MMIELADLIVPAATALAGFVAGRRARRTKAPEAIEPICPCEHSVSFHEKGTGRCHGNEERSRYNKYGEWVGTEYVSCTCQVYAGPELISSLTARPTTYREVADSADAGEGGRG